MIKTLTNGQWGAFLRRLATVYQKADDGTHEGGLIAMAHAEKHGDARRMLDIYNIMGKSTRKVGFLVWVDMFSPIRITETKQGTTVKLLRVGDKGYVPFDLVGAEARPFWTLEEAAEKVPAPLSADSFLKLILSYQGKVAKARKGEKFVIEGDASALDNLVSDVIADATRRAKALKEGPALAALDAPPAPKDSEQNQPMPTAPEGTPVVMPPLNPIANGSYAAAQ